MVLETQMWTSPGVTFGAAHRDEAEDEAESVRPKGPDCGPIVASGGRVTLDS